MGFAGPGLCHLSLITRTLAGFWPSLEMAAAARPILVLARCQTPHGTLRRLKKAPSAARSSRREPEGRVASWFMVQWRMVISERILALHRLGREIPTWGNRAILPRPRCQVLSAGR